MPERVNYSNEFVKNRILLVAMLAVILVLLGALWHIQVAQGSTYRESLAKQSLRRIRLPAQRGRIFDRNGVCLVDNRACYNVVLFLEALRPRGKTLAMRGRAQQVIDRLAVILGRPPEVGLEVLQNHMRKRLPLPLTLWRDVDEKAVARLLENTADFKGIELVVEPVRDYTQGGLAAHVLGYVGRAPDAAGHDEEPYHYYLPDTEGKRGVERVFNRALSGQAGERIVRIDASGFKHAEDAERDPQPGSDLVLSLDVRIQHLAEQALTNEAGAVVVMDVNTGDILALASAPSFDPNEFVPFLSVDRWNELSEDPSRPMNNRALGENYAPGSVFKPLVAIAALESGRASPGTHFDCPGYFALGTVRFRCWNSNGHGTIDLRKAIEQSCNTYFCALGLHCGYASIYAQAQAVGYGRKTGIALDGETSGLLPDEAWKRRVLHDDWRAGDTCNLSIGQGALSVTPLQVAVMLSAIANGGKVLKPRLVRTIRGQSNEVIKDFPVEIVRPLNWSPSTLKAVRGGMYDVIQAPTGTGQRARLASLKMGGKTGTAEFGAKDAGHKHTWMMVFAPFDNPQIATVMVLDTGVSGGVSVGPRIHDLMQGIFGDREGAGG